MSFTTTQRGLFSSAGVFEQSGTFIPTSQKFTLEQTSTFGDCLSFSFDGDFGDRPPGGAFTMHRIVRASVDGAAAGTLEVAGP